MTESSAQETAAATPVTAKTKKAITLKAKSGVKKVAPSHPPTSAMVNNAIKNLKERGGSSLQAIKKYISSTYKVDAEKIAPFIKKYLKSAVDSGALIRTKGKGASGSFKLAVGGSKGEGTKKPATKKPKAASGVKKVAKPTKEKKVATPKKAKSATKPKAVKPKAAKKSAKAPAAKKPKSPKPKKASPKKTAKKAKK